MNKNELIVIIDPQKDFTSEDGGYARRHAGITQIQKARQQISLLLKSLNPEKFAIVLSDYRKDQFEPGLSICIPGTPGHEADIDLSRPFSIFSKQAHSCFSSASFVSHLDRHEIDQLILCGFLAEYCVKHTAIDALEKAYDVVLIHNCIGTGDDVQNRKVDTLRELESKGAKLRSSWFSV